MYKTVLEARKSSRSRMYKFAIKARNSRNPRMYILCWKQGRAEGLGCTVCDGSKEEQKAQDVRASL